MKTKKDKDARLVWQKEQEEKIRYIKRLQEERESKRSLKDFLRHLKEETEGENYPTPD